MRSTQIRAEIFRGFISDDITQNYERETDCFCAKFIQRVKGLSHIAAPSLVKHVDPVVQRDKSHISGIYPADTLIKEVLGRNAGV